MSTKKPRTSRLGRGLSSLMAAPVQVQPAKPATAPPVSDLAEATAAQADTDTANHPGNRAPVSAEGLAHLPVGHIRPNRNQPRQRFEPSAIRSLAESIARDGVMQPVVVRPLAERDGAYELIAGERRWRAAQQAGLETIPALVRDLDDEQSAEWALIENLQREDLNPIEKAEAFKRLSDQFKLTHAQVAERVGLERSTISNLLRLLDLSDFCRDLIRENVLTMGHARALAGLSDSGHQRVLAERIVREGLSVRQAEQEARRLGQGTQSTPARPASTGSPLLSDLEKQIGSQLGTRVKIKAGRKKGAGTLSIDFYSLDQFDTLLERMSVKAE